LVNLADAVFEQDAEASRSLLEKALSSPASAPFAARRLAEELLPFRLDTAKLLLEYAVKGLIDDELESKAAAELLDEVNDILSCEKRRITKKCRWIGPCSESEVQPGASVDLIGYRARRGLLDYDYVAFCGDRLDASGRLAIGFRRAPAGSRSWEALDDDDAALMRRIIGMLPDPFLARIEEVRAWISETDPWKPCDIDLEALGVINAPICGTDERVRSLLC